MEHKQPDYFYPIQKDNMDVIYNMLSLVKASKGGIDFIVFVCWQLIMVFIFAFAYWVLAHANRCPKGDNCEFYGLGPHSSLMDFFYYSLTTQTINLHLIVFTKLTIIENKFQYKVKIFHRYMWFNEKHDGN